MWHDPQRSEGRDALLAIHKAFRTICFAWDYGAEILAEPPSLSRLRRLRASPAGQHAIFLDGTNNRDNRGTGGANRTL